MYIFLFSISCFMMAASLTSLCMLSLNSNLSNKNNTNPFILTSNYLILW